MRLLFSSGLLLRNVVLVGSVAVGSAIASPAVAEIATPQPAQANLSPEPPLAVDAEALAVEVPAELEELRELGRRMGDRLSEIDPKVIEQVMRPLGRQALGIFLESAPGLSQRAIELGERGLAELEKRATARLEQAQEEFEDLP